MFTVRWEFDVRPERVAEFLAIYGPAGDWVQLFATGAGYRGTELQQTGPTRWLTVDRWDSLAAYEAFRTTQAAAYAVIDARCEALTMAERKVDERFD